MGEKMRTGEKMRELNPAHLERVIELINGSQFIAHMGIRMEELGRGYCRSTMTVDGLLNAFGGIHGGAYAALLDNATYWSLYCDMEEDMGYTTIDLSVSDLRSVSAGVVTCEARAVKHGRTISLAEAEVRDESGRILAHATSKFFASPTIQPISAAVAHAGVDPLPPKFLEA